MLEITYISLSAHAQQGLRKIVVLCDSVCVSVRTLIQHPARKGEFEPKLEDEGDGQLSSQKLYHRKFEQCQQYYIFFLTFFVFATSVHLQYNVSMF